MSKHALIICILCLLSAAAFAQPQPTSVVPNSGITLGNTEVKIYGDNFSLAGTTTVTFGGLAATNVQTHIEGTAPTIITITCNTPPHAAGAVDVVVTNVGGPNPGSGTLVNGYTYFAPISPYVVWVQVQDGLHIDVNFDGIMGTGDLVANNYTVSGSGMGNLGTGSSGNHPSTVTWLGMAPPYNGTRYRLTWTTGEMVLGGDIRIDVANVYSWPANILIQPNNPGWGIDVGGAIGVRPTVLTVQVVTGRTVDITFSEAMQAAGMAVASNFVVSGTGKGSLNSSPQQVPTNMGGNRYRLTWITGEMVNGGDITITATGVRDLAGNLIGSPNNGTHLGGGIGTLPTMTNCAVQTGLIVDVMFSEAMAADILDPANYTVSGSGKGTLADHPNGITWVSGNYRLTWTAGEMLIGGDITITATNVHDVAGNPIGNPNSRTHLGAGVGVRPTVSSVTVQTTRSVDVLFSEAMGVGADVPANYALSGSGQGTLGLPDGVSLVSPNTYRLTWSTGEMHIGGDITITVTNVYDVAGNLIGLPNSRTHAGGAVGTNPTVSSVVVVDGLVVDVTFGEAIANGADASANYTVSGSGQGTLAANPNTVTLLGGNNYRLMWASGEMRNGGDITITAANMFDAAANPLGVPASGTHAGGGIGVLPTVMSVRVDTGYTVNVEFSEPMGAGVLDPASYTLSGGGQGTLASQPIGVALVSGNIYRLIWEAGDMVNGGDITITVSGPEDLATNPMGVPNSGTHAGGGIFVMPSADVITPITPNPTNGNAITFSVGFSKYVFNFNDASDLVIVTTGTVVYSGATISGGPKNYTVDLTDVTGDGTITLAVSTDSDVQDQTANLLVSSVTSAEVVVDHTAPTVVSITPATPSPTNATTLVFAVQFSEDVRNFDETDLVITETTYVLHSSVAILGGPALYTVNVNGVSGNGTMTLAVNTASDVQDPATNPLESSVVSPPVTIDQIAPTVTAVTPITPSPTNSPTIAFTVEFSEPMQNFDAAADLVITETTGVLHSNVAILGGPTLYTVNVNGVTGDGAMTLSVNLASDVQDLATNPLAATMTSSSVSMDHSLPTAQFLLLNNNPTEADAVTYVINFSESIGFTFTRDDIALSGSLAGGATFELAGSDPTFVVTITLGNPDADGDIGISIPAGAVSDGIGNLYAGGAPERYAVFNWHGFVSQPQDGQIYATEGHTFNVVANCGSPSLVYQWKFDDGATVQDFGPNASAYGITNAQLSQVGDYWCEVSYDGITHESARATLEIEEHLRITGLPLGGFAESHQPHLFQVVTAGGYPPLTYVWTKDGAIIPGATDAEYLIPSCTAYDNGSYVVQISDSLSDTVVSQSATLTVAVGVPALGWAGLALLGGMLVLAGGTFLARRIRGQQR